MSYRESHEWTPMPYWALPEWRCRHCGSIRLQIRERTESRRSGGVGQWWFNKFAYIVATRGKLPVSFEDWQLGHRRACNDGEPVR